MGDDTEKAPVLVALEKIFSGKARFDKYNRVLEAVIIDRTGLPPWTGDEIEALSDRLRENGCKPIVPIKDNKRPSELVILNKVLDDKAVKVLLAYVDETTTGLTAEEMKWVESRNPSNSTDAAKLRAMLHSIIGVQWQSCKMGNVQCFRPPDEHAEDLLKTVTRIIHKRTIKDDDGCNAIPFAWVADSIALLKQNSKILQEAAGVPPR